MNFKRNGEIPHMSDLRPMAKDGTGETAAWQVKMAVCHNGGSFAPTAVLPYDVPVTYKKRRAVTPDALGTPTAV